MKKLILILALVFAGQFASADSIGGGPFGNAIYTVHFFVDGEEQGKPFAIRFNDERLLCEILMDEGEWFLTEYAVMTYDDDDNKMQFLSYTTKSGRFVEMAILLNNKYSTGRILAQPLFKPDGHEYRILFLLEQEL